MSDFPRLAEMGITDPKTLTGFEINSLNRVDILRIRQKREKGSLLPISRSWEFPRIQIEGPDKKKGTVLKTSPVLREIEAELQALMAEREKKLSTIEAVYAEMQELSNEFEMRMRHLRETLEILKKEQGL